MKSKILIPIFLFASVLSLNAQNIAITDEDTYTADASAMLDIYSTSKGLLVPRITTIEMGLISSPATGLMVFNTNDNNFYYYNGTIWTLLNSSAQSSFWQSDGSSVYLDNLDLNVGIGTTTPTSKFEVVGDISASEDDALFTVKNQSGQVVF